MTEQVIFTNMCMVYDQEGNVLVQDRVDPDWGGLTFPGGHVESGESFSDSVIREIYEETGLHIQHPQLCGVKWWPIEDGARYVVLCYKTDQFSGKLVSSSEGKMQWLPLNELQQMKMASGMEFMLQLFLNPKISEHCFQTEGAEWINVLK